VYILIECSSKNLCGIAQLDVGHVTICSAERTTTVLWCSVAQHGWMGTLQIGIRALVFNTEPGWAKKVELKRNVTDDLFQSGQISFCRASMVKSNNNWAKFGKIPNFCC
jgi:hypothetical protein